MTDGTVPLRLRLSAYATKETIFSEQLVGSKIPGNAAFREQIALILTHLAMKYPSSFSSKQVEDIISLIQSPDEMVSLTIMNHLLSLPNLTALSEDSVISLQKILWEKTISDANLGLGRVAAMELLDRFLARDGELNVVKRGELDWYALYDLVRRPRLLPLQDAALRVLGKAMLEVWVSTSVGKPEKQKLLRMWLELVVSASHEDMVGAIPSLPFV